MYGGTAKAARHLSNRFLQDDPTALIKQASSYFDSLGLADVQAGDLDPNIQDSDGLVSYVVASTNPPPKEIKELYEEVAPVMEGLTNVVVSAILKQAGTDDAKKHDPKLWEAPMQAMTKAFCAGFSQEKKQYNQQIRGVEVSTKFLNILIDAVVSEGTAAFN
ncbi:MAG TPA: hypothetical protein VEF04_21315, partial [Blastocatellia bacterium]|nr:hypothetical protein [Blastocatellia bacterium]